MGEYEPDDSRDVTLRRGPEPGGIERTGPREGETRRGGKRARKEDWVQDLNTEAVGARQARAGKEMAGEAARSDPERHVKATEAGQQG